MPPPTSPRRHSARLRSSSEIGARGRRRRQPERAGSLQGRLSLFVLSPAALEEPIHFARLDADEPADTDAVQASALQPLLDRLARDVERLGDVSDRQERVALVEEDPLPRGLIHVAPPTPERERTHRSQARGPVAARSTSVWT